MVLKKHTKIDTNKNNFAFLTNSGLKITKKIKQYSGYYKCNFYFCSPVVFVLVQDLKAFLLQTPILGRAVYTKKRFILNDPATKFAPRFAKISKQIQHSRFKIQKHVPTFKLVLCKYIKENS